MGNRLGSDKNKKKEEKKKEEKKKEKELKKQKGKKKAKNRNSVAISEHDSQVVFESSEDLVQGACAAPSKTKETKSPTQPDVLADITFDPATRPRVHSTHGAWSSDEESQNSTLGYSTPLLRTPKIQRSAHDAAKTKESSDSVHECGTREELTLSQSLNSSPGEVRLRNKSESLSPASSPGLSRDVRKKRALGQAIHENGSSKAIEAAILFAPPVSQKQNGNKLPGIMGTPEISFLSEDHDSLEDALCPWLKDDDVSMGEEQLDEMFISCIDLSYSMADACSEKEFTGGSEADFSSLETRSKTKSQKETRNQAGIAPCIYGEWEGSSVDPVLGTGNAIRTPSPYQPRSSPMLTAHQHIPAEQNNHQHRKVKAMGSSDSSGHAQPASYVDVSHMTSPMAVKHRDRESSESQNTNQQSTHVKGNEAAKPTKKTGKSKDKRRKNSKIKIVPSSEHEGIQVDSNVSAENENKYQGSIERGEIDSEVVKTKQVEDDILEDGSKEHVSLPLAVTSNQYVDTVPDEPHRFLGDGQTPADFAASIMFSMSNTSPALHEEPKPTSDPQPMSKLVQRITEFIREETGTAEVSRPKLQKQSSLDNKYGARPQIASDTYSQVLDNVFMNNDKPNSEASFTESYSHVSSDLENVLPWSADTRINTENSEHSHTNNNINSNGDENVSPPPEHTDKPDMCQSESPDANSDESASSETFRNEQHSDVHGLFNDALADQIVASALEVSTRSHSFGVSDTVNSDVKSDHVTQPKSNSTCLDENIDELSNTLPDAEIIPSKSSNVQTCISSPEVTGETEVNKADACSKAESADELSNALLENVASTSSNVVPPSSPSAMDALAELDEDDEAEGQTDSSNDQKSREMQQFGDSVFKRLSYLVESQGNESNDEDENSIINTSTDVFSTEGKDISSECTFTDMPRQEHVPHKYDSEVPSDVLLSNFIEDNKTSKPTLSSEVEREVVQSTDESSGRHEQDGKATDKAILTSQSSETSESIVEAVQSTSNIINTDSQNKERNSNPLSNDHDTRGHLETVNDGSQLNVSLPLDSGTKKGSSSKRKGKNKKSKAKAKAKRLQAKVLKAKDEEQNSKDNRSPKIIVKRPKIPEELTHIECHENIILDSNTGSNSDSNPNPKPPKRESQQITEVIDAYGDAVNTVVDDDEKQSTENESERTGIESGNTTVTQELTEQEGPLISEDRCTSSEIVPQSASVDADVVQCRDIRNEPTRSAVPEIQFSSPAKRPQGLSLQRIIQDNDQMYKREAKESWELSDESGTTEESFENIDYLLEKSPECQSSSSADSVFRIPDISETIGEMDSVKNILDDFEDRTPQAEDVSRVVGKEALKSQPDYLSVHRRSRMSPALTNRTESDLDISEMRDDISTDSMYADDEGDGTLLFSKSYTEQSGSGVLVSCTFYNSGHNREDSDDFWEECVDEAYHQIELSADAASTTFQDARKQMHEIHEHLRTLRLQMETLQEDLENATITPEPEFQTESDDKRLITD